VVYVTNAVKHFKFEERGKRRIHKKPSLGEIRACHPWLEAEVNLVKPAVIGCLGATAAQALLGNQFRLTKERGRPIQTSSAAIAIATVHPSAILRAPDPEARAAEYARFLEDLRSCGATSRELSVNAGIALFLTASPNLTAALLETHSGTLAQPTGGVRVCAAPATPRKTGPYRSRGTSNIPRRSLA